MGIKKRHTSEFKAKGVRPLRVALAALREDRTLSELASQFDVHPITIGIWKKAVTQGLPCLFEKGRLSNGKEEEQKVLIETLYQKIGEIGVEKTFLKKSSECKFGGEMAVGSIQKRTCWI